MIRWNPIFIFICIGLTSCDPDPARSLKIIDRPIETRPAEVSTLASPPPAVPAPIPHAQPAKSAVPAAARAEPFHLSACPPPPEESDGPSSLDADGTCAFQHHNPVGCESLGDDFIVVASRKAGDATLMVYINVEKYAGPGPYTEAQMFIGVQDKLNIWRWSSDDVNITVGGGEKFVDLPPTRLDAEPMRTNCTGPMTNFQCEAIGESPGFEHTFEMVSGKLQCEAK